MSKDQAEHTGLNCEEALAHLFAYLDEETDAEKRSYIERHLEECRACFSRAEFEKAFRAKIKQLGHEKAPAMLQQRMSALLDQF